MNVGSAIVGLAGAAIAFDGIWMLAKARFLLPTPRWGYPKEALGIAVDGGAAIGGIGIAAGSGVVSAYGPLSAGLYILALGVVSQCLCYAAAWWVNRRAGRPALS